MDSPTRMASARAVRALLPFSRSMEASALPRLTRISTRNTITTIRMSVLQVREAEAAFLPESMQMSALLFAGRS